MTLSGNQVLVYDDCQLTHQRVVPLPDYCANDSSLILSVAESAFRDSEQVPGTGMFVSTLIREQIHMFLKAGLLSDWCFRPRFDKASIVFLLLCRSY